MGGPSPEHEVSLKTGEMVADALTREKYEVEKFLISKDGEWEIPPQALKNHADAVFIAMHGTYGEDGTVQDILESVKIPYTGTGPLGSALAMNKFLSLRLFRDAGLKTPQSLLVTGNNWKDMPHSIVYRIRNYFEYPIVVKPNNSGSSVGVSVVKNEGGLDAAMHEAFHISREVLVQKFIEGKEVTCGVLDQGLPQSEFALLPTEIIPKRNNFFDYKSKYDPGGAEEITPARLHGYQLKQIQKAAVLAHRLIGCKGFSRTDMILTPKNELYILELNTIPGLTRESLLPKAAVASGINFPNLVEKIVHSAFFRLRY